VDIDFEFDADAARGELERLLLNGTLRRIDVSAATEINYVVASLFDLRVDSGDVYRLTTALLFEAALHDGELQRIGKRDTRPLRAAKHLFALSDYPEDDEARLPDTAWGSRGAWTMRELRTEIVRDVEIVRRGHPADFVGLRKRIAAVAANYGVSRGVLDAGDTRIEDTARALWLEMLAVLVGEEPLARLRDRDRDIARRRNELPPSSARRSTKSEATNHFALDQIYRRPREWQPREGLLAEAASLLAANKPAVLLLYGEPGMGKSWLAPEILHRARLGAPIFVLRCSSDAVYEHDLRTLLRLAGIDNITSVADVKVFVKEMLSTGIDSLGGVVFDGVVSLEELQLVVPEKPRVLLAATSNRRLAERGYAYLRVNEFNAEEAHGYLQAMLPDLDEESVRSLGRRFGYLPIALDALAYYLGTVDIEARASTIEELLVDALAALPSLTSFDERYRPVHSLYARLLETLPDDPGLLRTLDVMLWLHPPALELEDGVPWPLRRVSDSRQLRLEVAAHIQILESRGLIRVSGTRVSFHALTQQILQLARIDAMPDLVLACIDAVERVPQSRRELSDALRLRIASATFKEHEPRSDEIAPGRVLVLESAFAYVLEVAVDGVVREHPVLYIVDALRAYPDVAYMRFMLGRRDAAVDDPVIEALQVVRQVSADALLLFDFEQSGDQEAQLFRERLLKRHDYITSEQLDQHFHWARAQIDDTFRDQWAADPDGYQRLRGRIEAYLDQHPEHLARLFDLSNEEDTI
jgi:hypothetical protein